jgi:hypothetical protein
MRHMADAARDEFTSMPKGFKHQPAEDISNFCGQCHRTWEIAVRNHWRGPAFVRFQPYRLANSKCFNGGDRRISCLACHSPHQPLERNDYFYDAKCLACHRAAKPAAGQAAIKNCPIAKTRCVSCHMPKVELPGGHVLFTDHQIRIVRPGAPYPD